MVLLLSYIFKIQENKNNNDLHYFYVDNISLTRLKSKVFSLERLFTLFFRIGFWSLLPQR